MSLQVICGVSERWMEGELDINVWTNVHLGKVRQIGGARPEVGRSIIYPSPYISTDHELRPFQGLPLHYETDYLKVTSHTSLHFICSFYPLEQNKFEDTCIPNYRTYTVLQRLICISCPVPLSPNCKLLEGTAMSHSPIHNSSWSVPPSHSLPCQHTTSPLPSA